MIKTIKTTVVGGIVFLIPIGLLLLVLQEVLDLALLVASPLADLFPKDDIFGIALGTVLAWCMVVLGCYIFGLIATTRLGVWSNKMDDVMAQLVPGYRLIKTRISGLLNAEQSAELLKVVEVHQFGTMRWGVEVDRSPDGESVLIYYPGAPNPNNGTLQVVPIGQLKPTEMTGAQLILGHNYFGRNMLATKTPQKSGD